MRIKSRPGGGGDDKHWPRRGAINNEYRARRTYHDHGYCTRAHTHGPILYYYILVPRYVNGTAAGRITSDRRRRRRWSRQIGDFRARSDVISRTVRVGARGQGLILYDYCHHYYFLYGSSSRPFSGCRYNKHVSTATRLPASKPSRFSHSHTCWDFLRARHNIIMGVLPSVYVLFFTPRPRYRFRYYSMRVFGRVPVVGRPRPVVADVNTGSRYFPNLTRLVADFKSHSMGRRWFRYSYRFISTLRHPLSRSFAEYLPDPRKDLWLFCKTFKVE